MYTSRILPAVLCSLVLLGVGCSPESRPATPESPAAETPSAPLAQGGGTCDHPYYPLKQGTKVTFNTQAAEQDNAFSFEVTEASSDRATLTYQFGPTLHMESEIVCGDDGIHATGYLNMAGALSGGQLTSRTVSARGSILPNDFRVGSTWSSMFEVETQNTNPDAIRLGMGTGHMTMHTTSTALGEESVTVPAGTFDAIKVEMKMKTRMVLGGSIPPIDTETTSYSYFVRGKGMVKTETLDSRGTNSTMEATEILTP